MVQEQITLFLGCLAEFEFGSFQRSPLTQKGILILGFNDRQDEDWSRCGAGRSGPEFLAEIEAEDLPLTGAADVEAMGISSSTSSSRASWPIYWNLFPIRV